MLGWILMEYVDKAAGYKMVFLTCAVVFFVIGIASFFIDATRPIVRDSTDSIPARS